MARKSAMKWSNACVEPSDGPRNGLFIFSLEIFKLIL